MVTHSRLFFGAMTDHGVTPADRTDAGDPVAALFGAPSSAEGDVHQSPPFAGIDDDDTVTLNGIFAGRPSDTEEPPPGRRRPRRTRHSSRSGRRRTPSRPRVPQLNIGLPQVTAALLLRIVCVVVILVIGWLFLHLVLSARHGGTPVKTGASPATPTVMPDARGELLTARRVVQQAERRTVARRAAASRAAARQRADRRRAAALRAARRRAARARARRATPPPPPPAPRSTTTRPTTSPHSSPTTRPQAPAPPASGGTQGYTPGDLPAGGSPRAAPRPSCVPGDHAC